MCELWENEGEGEGVLVFVFVVLFGWGMVEVRKGERGKVRVRRLSEGWG